VLLDAGVKAVVQPGGSVRDEEVIAAAKAADVTMYFTSERHFYHCDSGELNAGLTLDKIWLLLS
jgi:hypothetical protein